MSIWQRAAAVGAATPESRNRYVDFLRALSILAVISGHWIIAAPFVTGGEVTFSNMFQHQPWTRWLTWGFQVMPVFFLVGGYSNGVSCLAGSGAVTPSIATILWRRHARVGTGIQL